MLLATFLNWALFAAKTITLVVGILITVAFIVGLAMRQRKAEETLEITSLNEKYEHLAEGVAHASLPKKGFKAFKKAQKKSQENCHNKPTLYVLKFEGDMAATAIKTLREEVSTIINYHQPEDQVLIILESAGGLVHRYGLAAAQLERLKAAKIRFTVAVDTMAASGGYLMAVVADHIVASRFAVIGSIGVVAQMPNFHRLLNKHDIDVELHTAGKYKRTLTLFGENTRAGREKFQEELNETQTLFKSFVSRYRPQLDIESVATGEHWYGEEAIKRALIDSLGTSDEFIQSHLQSHQVLLLAHCIPEKLKNRMSQWFKSTTNMLMHAMKPRDL